MARVLVTVPYWRSPDTVRRAVGSILGQTHRDLLCVVINDGDAHSPPWPALAGIRDPRLLRLDLPHNRGRYFADAVAAAACPDGWWWSPHDADDWSHRKRFAALLDTAKRGTEVVLGSHVDHPLDGRPKIRRVRSLDGVQMRIRVHMSGLWRPAAARLLVNPGWRIGWASLMTSAALLAGRTALLRPALYHRVRRPGSLVTDPTTGPGSPLRVHARRRMAELWAHILTAAPDDLDGVAAVLRREEPQLLAAEVRHHADRLRTMLEDTS